MAILNLTPDSFSDGGAYPTLDEAIGAAERAVVERADILDLGGESTRPGAGRVPADKQILRVIPVLKAIRARGGPLSNTPISIDTTLAPVAAAAIDAGATIINDVSAGTEDPAIFDLAAKHKTGLVLMHRLAPPGADSYSDRYANPPVYQNVVATVRDFLVARAALAESRGVARTSIILDPGLGFGKTVEQNLELIRRTGELAALGYPILSGISRKSFAGRAAGMESSTPAERLAPSLALTVAHYAAGASVFRVHDVAPTIQSLTAATQALP
jgi:dihydropteroate synthase